MPSAAVVSPLEALAHDAEADLLAREAADVPVQDDFAADEEAAAFMSS
jgi:hypothetical protein